MTARDAIDQFNALAPEGLRTITSFVLRSVATERGQQAEVELSFGDASGAKETKLTLVFRNVRSLEFTPASVPVPIASLQIEPVGDHQWEEINYVVKDEHGDQIRFWCSDFRAMEQGA